MPPTFSTNSPRLSIHFAAGPKQIFHPGGTIVGHLSRSAFLQRGIVNLTVRLYGRSKSRIVRHHGGANGSKRTTYRARCYFFNDGTQQLAQLVYNGPVDISAPLDTSESWPFALTIPEFVHMRPDGDLAEFNLLPNSPQGIASHRLPDTFMSPGGHSGEGYIEYYLEATMRMTGESDIVVTHPVIVRSPVPHAISDFVVKRWCNREAISTYNLQPNIQELTKTQKWYKFVHSSKVPRCTTDIFVAVPTVVQLGHNTPLPIQLRAGLNEPGTSDAIKEYNHVMTLKSADLDIIAASTVVAAGTFSRKQDDYAETFQTCLGRINLGQLEEPITVPIGFDNTTIDVGALLQLQLMPDGLYSAGKKLTPFKMSYLQPDFTTFNISLSHIFTWNFVFEIAGKVFSKKFSFRTTIVAPALHAEEPLPRYEAPPYEAK